MAAWTATSARTALRNNLGVNSTQLSDDSADAALAHALDLISRAYPYVTSSTLASQSSKRLSVTGLTSPTQVLAIEVPVDSDPREFKRFEYEEEGTIRLPAYEPATETVRVWFAGIWTVTTLLDSLQQDCLICAGAYALRELASQGVIYWSQGGDSGWGYVMRDLIRDRMEEWRRRENNLQNRGAVLLNRFGTHRGRVY